MTKHDNPPAFPPNAGWRDLDPAYHGMTLRDWFAGQALAGILARGSVIDEKRTAKFAFEHADAMLAARNALVQP